MPLRRRVPTFRLPLTPPMTRRPFSLPWLAFYAFLVGLTVLGALFIRWNTTPSIPPGFYLRIPFSHNLAVGDDAVACIPPGRDAEIALERTYIPPSWRCASGTEPLIKHVVATAGDTVRLDSSGAFVGARKVGLAPPTRDNLGYALVPRYGDHVLGPGQVWLGSDIVNGYDSRYIGPVDARYVLGRATLLMRF